MRRCWGWVGNYPVVVLFFSPSSGEENEVTGGLALKSSNVAELRIKETPQYRGQ